MFKKVKIKLRSFIKVVLWILFVGLMILVPFITEVVETLKTAIRKTYNWAGLFLVLINLLYLKPCLYLDSCKPFEFYQKLGLFHTILIELGLYVLLIIILYLFQIFTYGKSRV